MENIEIIRILHKYNPWWSHKPIPPSKIATFRRENFSRIKKDLARKEITSIIGPRRVGKTILMHQLISDLLDQQTDPKTIFYLSVDEIQFQKNNTSLGEILEIYESHILQKSFDSLEKTIFMFLDEIQEIKDWGKILKNWQDYGYNIKFIISGSSSIWITKGIEESLLGRINTFVMLPLKFSEYLRYKGVIGDVILETQKDVQQLLKKAIEENDSKKWHQKLEIFAAELAGKRHEIEKHLRRYLIVGGYPEFLDEEDFSGISELLRDKIKLIFFKDIVRYFEIRNASVLEDLFKLIAKNSGAYFNVAGTAATLGIERPTLKDYLSYLMKAYLIESSEFFSESRKKRLNKQEKIYILDAGMRNATVDYLDESLLINPTELGYVVEGVLFEHLMKLKYILEPGPEQKIFYWKGRKEVDFILTVKQKGIPIESKYSMRIRDLAKETIQACIQEIRAPFGIIVTKNEFKREDNILEIPLWIFLLII